MTELTVELGERRSLPPGGPAAPDQANRLDVRFRDLLGLAGWQSLPAAVRRRFSSSLDTDGRRIFVGRVVSVSHSRAGLWLARLARVVGGPLPDTAGACGLSTVVVTRDDRIGGQVWSRTYARPGRMPQTINSVKRFGGPTGLEEYIGAGLVMALTLHAEDGALVFRSAGYAIVIAGRRVPLPSALSPGCCTITHRDLGAGPFSFTLSLDHPWLGRLVHQIATYEEITP